MRIQTIDQLWIKSAALAAIAGRRLQVKVLQQWRDMDLRAELDKWELSTRPALTEVLKLAYLIGMRDGYAQFDSLSLSLHARAISYLSKRLKVGNDVLEQIEKKADAKGLLVLSKAADFVELKLQRVILDLTKKGAHITEGKAELQKAFQAAGIHPSNSFQLENIFRTQTQIAHQAGRWQAEQDPAIQDILWGYRYYTARDDRVRDNHRALDGTTLPKEHPAWDTIYPPNGWSCRCRVVPITDFKTKQHDLKPGAQADKGFSYNPGKVFGPVAGT